ncbi:MAG TPA: OsmC family protein [Rubrobacteraceae bacterium]|nr:OsmC family protein [Rubrobacteraceae bacterium]
MADIKKMTIQHLGDQRYAGRNDGGDRILIDGSDDTTVGVRPMEALLAALGACTAFDVVSILAKRRTPVESYRIELEGERADDHPRRYTRILVRHVVSGDGITPESLERAVALSHEKYCSVAATLNSEIESEAVLEE